MPDLCPSDFAAFFHAVRVAERARAGKPNRFKGTASDAPYGWQQELADRLCHEGTWPAVLDLPTGSGKTTALDAAVFHLAYERQRGAARRAALRIAHVVDRRLVVDQVFDHAQAIRRALDAAEDPITRTVRKALLDGISAVGPNEPNNSTRRHDGFASQLDGRMPLVVTRLRGGMPQEGDWARTPDQPTIICSTVDQVGSRLLFRGYGVKPGMRPIHAGLLGNDTLFLLDEVHLSEPFRQTLFWVNFHRRAERTPWAYVELSATARPGIVPRENVDRIQLTERDRSADALGARLRAAKPAELVLLGRLEPAERATRYADLAIERSALGNNPAGKKVLIVVNRVALARDVHDMLSARVRDRADHVLCLIGRNREVAKVAIRKKLLAALSNPEHTCFVVATQSIEVGVDLDFDSLVTQAAPLDALRQRFGRLNRGGRPIAARAAIVAAADEVAGSARPDPVYADRIKETWAWLAQHATTMDDKTKRIDFGIGTLDDLLGREPNIAEKLSSPHLDAPILTRPHVALWASTRPEPHGQPDPALYLHGPNSLDDVQIVWRADLHDIAASRSMDDYLAAVPPRNGEALPLPLAHARRLLRGMRDRATADVADVEGTSSVLADTDPAPKAERAVWRWLGSDCRAEAIDASAVTAGDLVIVDATTGGCDAIGWDPRRGDPVDDVANEAGEPYARRTFAVRINRALLPSPDSADESEVAREARANNDRLWKRISSALKDVDPSDAVAVLDALEAIEDLPAAWQERLDRLPRKRLSTVQPYRNGVADGIVLVAPFGQSSHSANGDELVSGAWASTTEESDRGSLGGRRSLAAHGEDVQALARGYGASVGVSVEVADDIALAAYLHDAGKADPRFQAYLAGDRWLIPDEPLAKSGRDGFDRAYEHAAWLRSELPQDWRHEALSVRLALHHPRFSEANDPELVLWLIGTHHGWGRPGFPHADRLDNQSRTVSRVLGTDIRLPAEPGPQALDFQLALADPTPNGRRFATWTQIADRLHDRYGYWGLAHLEAIVRLADHRASQWYADRENDA